MVHEPVKSMVKKTVVSLSACATFGIVAVVSLIAISDWTKRSQGSFLRLFPSDAVEKEYSLSLRYNSYYIAGGTNSKAYLGNYLYPLHVLEIDLNLRDTVHRRLTIDNTEDEKFWSVRLSLDSPFFYLYDGVVPRIYRGNIVSWCGEPLPHDDEFFQAFEPISERLQAIRSLHKVSGANMLGIISTDSPHYRFNDGILKKQVDGVFCTDGMMQYNRESNRLYYVYRYRNGIIEVDTTLKVTRVSTTIDTVSFARITVDTIDANGATTFSSPPLQVNKRIATARNLLLVNSGLLARNEPSGAHRRADVIDVYGLEGMRYRFSFYLYRFNGQEKLRDFIICGHRLVVLYDTHLEVVHLNEKYFGPGAV